MNNLFFSKSQKSNYKVIDFEKKSLTSKIDHSAIVQKLKQNFKANNNTRSHQDANGPLTEIPDLFYRDLEE